VSYKDDPTILAWELINEPRCPSDPSGDTLQVFIFIFLRVKENALIRIHYRNVPNENQNTT
jgi:hypothetical protein